MSRRQPGRREESSAYLPVAEPTNLCQNLPANYDTTADRQTGMASSPFHKRPIALAPLNGVRVLACTGITLFHVALLFVAAGSAWHW